MSDEQKTTLMKEYMRLIAKHKAWLSEPGLSLLEQWDRADWIRDEAMTIIAKQWKAEQEKQA